MSEEQTNRQGQRISQAVDRATRLDHLKTGYCNAQDIIKFIDTKTGIILGICTVLMGSIASLLPWYFEQDETTKAFLLGVLKSPYGVSGAKVAVASLACGLASLFCCLRSLIGRAPPASKLVYNILFPFFPPAKIKHAKKAYIERINDLSDQQITSEYRHQLVGVGQILYQKMVWHWRSLKALALQILCLVIASVLFAIPTFGINTGSPATKGAIDPSAQSEAVDQPHREANIPTLPANQ